MHFFISRLSRHAFNAEFGGSVVYVDGDDWVAFDGRRRRRSCGALSEEETYTRRRRRRRRLFEYFLDVFIALVAFKCFSVTRSAAAGGCGDRGVRDMMVSICDVQRVTVHSPSFLLWLSSSPFGLKQSTSLSENLTYEIIMVTRVVGGAVRKVLDIIPSDFHVRNVLAGFGARNSLGVISKVLSFAVLPTMVVKSFTSRLFSCLISLSSSLLQLFNSKKFNPARNRNDTYATTDVEVFLIATLASVCGYVAVTIGTYYGVGWVAGRAAELPIWGVKRAIGMVDDVLGWAWRKVEGRRIERIEIRVREGRPFVVAV